MTDMLTLPARIDSDLGRPKIEEPVADLDRDLAGREWNAVTRWIELYGQLFGKTDGSTADSIFARIAALEASGDSWFNDFASLDGWTVTTANGGTVKLGPSATAGGFPSSGVVQLGNTTTAGSTASIFEAARGMVLGATSPIVVEYRIFVQPADNGCRWVVGVSDGLGSGVAFSAELSGASRVNKLVVSNSGVETKVSLSALPAGNYFRIRLTITETGATCHVAANEGSYASFGSITHAVDQKVYCRYASIARDSGATPDGRLLMIDWTDADASRLAADAGVAYDNFFTPASSGVPTSRLINTGTYLTGGGHDMSSDFTLDVNTTLIATRAYVDAIAQGLSIKNSVRVATTANGTLATAFANGQTVDGVVLATGNRILLKNQSSAAENGVYVVNASGAPTRATDFDASADVATGAFVFVQEGTANADSGWVLTTDGTINVGVTSLAFTQFSGAGQITAGTGLLKSGNTLSADFGAGAGKVLQATSADIITAFASLAATLGVNNQRIASVADPTSAQDAATKNYVDLETDWEGLRYAGEPPEDFLHNTGVAGTLWQSSLVGTGAGVSGLGNVAGHPGICVLSMGTTTTGRATIYRGAATAFRIGTDAWIFQAIICVPTLPTAGEDFSIFVGGGELLGAEPTNGLYLMLPSNASALGTNWLACSANGGTRTRTSTGVASSAGGWIRLKIVLNAAGTSAVFSINGSVVATLTTNLPGATAMWDEAAIALKNAGTTNRDLQVDRIGQRFLLATSR